MLYGDEGPGSVDPEVLQKYFLTEFSIRSIQIRNDAAKVAFKGSAVFIIVRGQGREKTGGFFSKRD